MTQRIASMLVLLGLFAWGCGDLKGDARRDTQATLARLRAAGVTARIEITKDDAAEHARRLRLRAEPNAALIVISSSQVAIDFPAPLSERLGDERQSLTMVWSSPYVARNDPEGAARAAARGLLVDLMKAGTIPPRPVPPLLLMTEDAVRAPSYHGLSGALIVIGVVLLGSYLARRGRRIAPLSDSMGGDG